MAWVLKSSLSETPYVIWLTNGAEQCRMITFKICSLNVKQIISSSDLSFDQTCNYLLYAYFKCMISLRDWRCWRWNMLPPYFISWWPFCSLQRAHDLWVILDKSENIKGRAKKLCFLVAKIQVWSRTTENLQLRNSVQYNN